MNTKLILILLFFIQGFISVSKAQIKPFDANSKEYKNIINLHKKALSLEKQGKVKQAINTQLDASLAFGKTFGNKHHYFGALLFQLGTYLLSDDQFDQALKMFISARTNLSNSLGKEHKDYGKYTDYMAKSYRELGKYDQAISLHKEAIEHAKISYSEESPEYAIRMNELGTTYFNINQYKDALAIFKKSSYILKTLKGEMNINYVVTLSNQALIYTKLSNFNQAEKIYIKTIKILEEIIGKNSVYYWQTLNNYGTLLQKKGQLSEAVSLLKEACVLAKKNKGETHSSYLIYSNNLAIVFEELGNFQEALKIHEGNLIHLKRKWGKEHPRYFRMLGNVGPTYSKIGEMKKAFMVYKEALELGKKLYGDNHIHLAVLFNNIGVYYKHIGEHIKAEEAYKKSIEITKAKLGEGSLKFITRSSNLAKLYYDNSDFEKAVPIYYKILKITENSLGKDHSEYAKILKDFGMLYMTAGKNQKSLEFLEKAKDIMKTTLREDHIEYSSVLNLIGLVYTNLNNQDKALSAFKESLKIHYSYYGRNSSMNDNLLQNMIGSYFIKNNFEEVLKIELQRQEIFTRDLTSKFSFLTPSEKEKYINNIIGKDLKTVHNLNFLNHDEMLESQKLGLNRIISTKGLLLNASKNIFDDLIALNDNSIDKKIEELRLKKGLITKQLQLPVSNRIETLEKEKESLAGLERELLDIYSKKFKKETNYFRDHKNVDLKENEIAVEFTNFKFYNKKWTDSTMYVAYLYKKDWKAPKVVNLFEERQLRKYLTTNSSPNKLYQTRGGALVQKQEFIADSIYNLVWKPLEPYVQNTTAIYYSPDGLLHKIPFAALPNLDNKLLGERYNLNQMGNTADIRKHNSQPDLNDVLLIGGVNYNYVKTADKKLNSERTFSILTSEQLLGNEENKKRNAKGGSWSYLEGTAKEVNRIKTLLPKSKVLTQEQATETAFKKLSGKSPSVLHIATHGYFFPDIEKKDNNRIIERENNYVRSENPLLRTGLILANANYAWQNGNNPYEEDDGILTGLEISNLDLSNTDIVVLSACETGLGDIPSSEGVYGLQRAFKMAGVKTIVMTLWEVPDKETAEFMELFYTKWKANNQPKKAFKETQRFMMNKYRKEPEKWAAFVLFE